MKIALKRRLKVAQWNVSIGRNIRESLEKQIALIRYAKEYDFISTDFIMSQKTIFPNSSPKTMYLSSGLKHIVVILLRDDIVDISLPVGIYQSLILSALSTLASNLPLLLKVSNKISAV